MGIVHLTSPGLLMFDITVGSNSKQKIVRKGWLYREIMQPKKRRGKKEKK